MIISGINSSKNFYLQVPEAQYYLGLCYEDGLGVIKNEKQALELVKKSATQGNRKAIEKLQNREKIQSQHNLFNFIHGFRKLQ